MKESREELSVVDAMALAGVGRLGDRCGALSCDCALLLLAISLALTLFLE